MKVILTDITPNAVPFLVSEARICYGKTNVTEGKLTSSGTRSETELLEYLFEKKHLSIFEHAKASFFIKNISRCCANQLVRHRLCSFTQKSQRYTKEQDFEYVIPEKIKNNIAKSTIFIKAMYKAQSAYDELLLTCNPEDARYVLPNACCTELALTANFRQLFHMFHERLSNSAQHEIRVLHEKMFDLVQEKYPEIFKKEYFF